MPGAPPLKRVRESGVGRRGPTLQTMIPGVILAAGASNRMGRPKALLPTAVLGETFVDRLVSTLRQAHLDDVIVVTSREADGVAEAVRGLTPPPRLVENPDSSRGQLSSLWCALTVVDRPGVRAMLVMLVDAPLVPVETVRVVLEAYRATGAAIVRPVKGLRHGHPVIFDRSMWDELRRADPDVGAKAVLQAHRTDIVDVPVHHEGAFHDIDTPEEYERVFGRGL